MKMTVDFEECLKDSPRFRAALEEVEGDVAELELKLDRRDTKEPWEVEVETLLHMAKRMRKATIRQKSPMASERAKPRIA